MSDEPTDFPPFAVTVDLVVLSVRAGELSALAVKRGSAPYKGRWALPGGFVRPNEDLRAAAARELREETGVKGLERHLEQLASYGAPKRDPRMRVVSVAHLTFAPHADPPESGSDASAAQWVPVEELFQARLAFDHKQILSDGVERARSKLEYTPLAAAFLSEPFTVGELRQIYEAVWGYALDPRNFHRKVTGVESFLIPTGRTTARMGGRPAQLYERGEATVLYPPISRQAR